MNGSTLAAKRRRSAYTLIELVIVVLIVGILTSVSAPKYFSSLAFYRAEAAARRVANDLRLAREHAQKTSEPQTVDFDVAADGYAIPTMPDPDHPNATYAVRLGNSEYSVNVAAAVFGPGDTVKFDIYGRPDRTGSVTVLSGSQLRTVQVDDAGNVRIL